MRRITNCGGKQGGWSVGGCLPYQLPAWWALARNPSLIPWESAGACWVSQCCSERLPRGEQKPPEAVKKEPFVSICSAMCENAEFYRLEKDFPALFCVFREGSQWYPRVFTCKAIPADCAGRDPHSHPMSMKHSGPSSLLLLFVLPTISPGCTALEVVVLCSKDLCSVLPWLPRALIPASIPTTAHVNHAGNNTWEGVGVDF